MKRVGIFGGSFDPVHHGHLLAARAAFEFLKLDRLVFVPCYESAYGKKLLPAALRLKLLKAAVKGEEGFEVSDIEIRRKGVSRSIDTLRALRAKAPKDRYFLLIGADQAARFPKWKEAVALARLAKVCVLARPGSPKNTAIHKKFRMLSLKTPQIGISSSDIRSRLKRKLPIQWLLPAQVLKLLSPSKR